jgi:hypothetical protein
MRRREFIAGIGGAAASLPSLSLSVRAQQPARPVIGVLGFGASRPKNPDMEALRSGLAKEFEYRWANGDSSAQILAALEKRNATVATNGYFVDANL